MIKVVVPATSANCCIGFDCMGLAIDWVGTFSFMHSEKLRIEGCPKEYQTKDNLVVQAFQKVCDELGKEMPSFHLKIDSTIPFARGLGSSATCIVAGLMGANAWFNDPLSKEDLLVLATKMEGHPDNVAPALFGGACVSKQFGKKVVSRQLPIKEWGGLVIVPDIKVATKKARTVLPQEVSFEEAKDQVANALLMEVALCQGDELLLRECSVDHLHEPYRSRLIAPYERIRTCCQDLELPLWISGSGSTMIVLSNENEKIDRCVSLLGNLETRRFHVAKKGAYVLYE